MPVSLTRKVTQPPSPSSRATSRRTVPPSVNLQALERRLNRLWRTLVRSACMPPRSSGQWTSSRLAFFWASGWIVVTTSRIMSGTSKVSSISSILPDSILARSSTSLISASRCLPALQIFSRSGMNFSTPRSSASSRSSSL